MAKKKIGIQKFWYLCQVYMNDTNVSYLWISKHFIDLVYISHFSNYFAVRTRIPRSRIRSAEEAIIFSSFSSKVCSAKGTLFWILVGAVLLKTKGVNSGLGNRNMIRKIPTWWENSVLGNRNMAEKNSDMVGNFCGRKNVFRCMDHLVLRHPLYRPGFTYPFFISENTLFFFISTDHIPKN